VPLLAQGFMEAEVTEITDVGQLPERESLGRRACAVRQCIAEATVRSCRSLTSYLQRAGAR
jgi:hypothetical protein